MSDETLTDIETIGTENDDLSPAATDELAVLKQRARLMGVTFSNNIGIEALRTRIQAKLAEEQTESNGIAPPPELNDPSSPAKKAATLREQLIADAMKLVRVRITNMDPKKKDLPGEIYTVANNYIGTVSKYVPYGELTEDGYHIPNVIYQNLKERKFLNIRTTKKREGGIDHVRVEQSWATEFAFEVLPQLTPEELQKLATAQAAAGGL